MTKTHSGIVPARLENEGKFIEVRGNLTFISRKTPKRKKLNTPVKDNLSACRSLSFEDSNFTQDECAVQMDTSDARSFMYMHI